MLLAIDAGNTNIVFALFEGERELGFWRLATQRARDADEFAAMLLPLMHEAAIAIGAIDGAVIGSVVPTATGALKALYRTVLGVEPVVLGENAVLGIGIDVEEPRVVGADRLANAVAAHAAFGGPTLSVDFGTATKFDRVSADGVFQGGVIALGINLSIAALHRASAALPRAAVVRPPRVIGRSTEGALQSGLYWGYASMVEGVLKRIAAELGQAPRVIATGGLAPVLAQAVPAIHAVVPDLTVRGLALVHARTLAAQGGAGR
ncbi:MAG: type III pantothenate kinase [Alphaproteobacteria bacterium]|nr:type III pantothenate kinase [Alphaproteobacteria bacterium]